MEKARSAGIVRERRGSLGAFPKMPRSGLFGEDIFDISLTV